MRRRHITKERSRSHGPFRRNACSERNADADVRPTHQRWHISQFWRGYRELGKNGYGGLRFGTNRGRDWQRCRWTCRTNRTRHGRRRLLESAHEFRGIVRGFVEYFVAFRFGAGPIVIVTQDCAIGRLKRHVHQLAAGWGSTNAHPQVTRSVVSDRCWGYPVVEDLRKLGFIVATFGYRCGLEVHLGGCNGGCVLRVGGSEGQQQRNKGRPEKNPCSRRFLRDSV